MSQVSKLLFGIILSTISSKSHKLEPVQSGIACQWMIFGLLAVLFIQVTIHYIVNGAFVTWALPDFLFSFLGVTFLIKMLVVSVIGMLISIISMLVSFFYQHRVETQVA